MADLTDAEIETLVYTLLGEARGEGVDGMTIVANVIRNRASEDTPMFPNNPAAVALQSYQFSSNNTGAGGNLPATKREAPVGSPLYKQAERIVRGVFISNTISDNTGNALYYHTPAVSPKWSSKVATPYTFQAGGNIVYARQPVAGAAPTPAPRPAFRSNNDTTAASRIAALREEVRIRQLATSNPRPAPEREPVRMPPMSDVQYAAEEAARRARVKIETQAAVDQAARQARIDMAQPVGQQGRGGKRPAPTVLTNPKIRVADTGLITHIRPTVKVDSDGNLIVDQSGSIKISGGGAGRVAVAAPVSASVRVAAARANVAVASNLALSANRSGSISLKPSVTISGGGVATPGIAAGANITVTAPPPNQPPGSITIKRHDRLVTELPTLPPVQPKSAPIILPSQQFKESFVTKAPAPKLSRVDPIGTVPKWSDMITFRSETDYGSRSAKEIFAGTEYETLASGLDTMKSNVVPLPRKDPRTFAPQPRPASERPKETVAPPQQERTVQRATGPSGRGRPNKVSTQTLQPQKPTMVSPNASGRLKAAPLKPSMKPVVRPMAPRVVVPGPIKKAAPRALDPVRNIVATVKPGLTPSQTYAATNEAARLNAIANSSNPEANTQRASLASQWGFD